MARHFVTGLFENTDRAKDAVERLLEEGFRADEVGVIVADREERQAVPVRHETAVAEGAVAGGALGAVLGALGAALVSVGTLPAVGLGLAASGPLVAAASGAVGGATGGGFVGAVAGLGFWHEVPDLPEDLEGGAVLVSVPTAAKRASAVRTALTEAGAKWIEG